MESSIAEFLERQLASELLPTKETANPQTGDVLLHRCFVLICCFAKATLCDFSARAASRLAMANLHTTDSRDQENKLERSIPSATKFSHENKLSHKQLSCQQVLHFPQSHAGK